MKKLKPQVDQDGRTVGWCFWCPGCNEAHSFSIIPNHAGRPGWSFNGDQDAPTFFPSLLYPTKPVRCHLILTAGKIQFCADCGHQLAGQVVDLPELPEWLQ